MKIRQEEEKGTSCLLKWGELSWESYQLTRFSGKKIDPMHDSRVNSFFSTYFRDTNLINQSTKKNVKMAMGRKSNVNKLNCSV